MALGDREGARKAFSTALKQDPGLAKQVFSVLWSSTSSPRELREFAGHEPRVCVLLAEFLREQGFRDDAEMEYAEAALLGGEDYQVVSGLIRSYFKDRAYDKVLDLVERLEKARVFADPPQRATLRYSAGMAHFIQGDLEGAVSAYETALRFDESRLHIHHALAEAFLKQKEYSKAIARWRFVLENDARRRQLGPGVEAAYLGLAQAYEGQGKYAEALAQYLRASKMDPQNGSIAAKIADVSRRL